MPGQEDSVRLPYWFVSLIAGAVIGFCACIYSGCWCGGNCECESHHQHESPVEQGPGV